MSMCPPLPELPSLPSRDRLSIERKRVSIAWEVCFDHLGLAGTRDFGAAGLAMNRLYVVCITPLSRIC